MFVLSAFASSRFKSILGAAALLLFAAGLAWLVFSPQVEIAFARNVLLYRAEGFWRAIAPHGGDLGAPPGLLSGYVRGEQGEPLAGALVLAADADGRTFTAETDGAGRYQMQLPPGVYVPMAAKAGYDDTALQFLGLKRSVAVAADHSVDGADLWLRRSPARMQTADGTLRFFDDAIAHTDVPAPADVRRRGFAFVRASTVLTGSYVYEPPGDGPFPVLLFIYPCWVYPCSTLGWDLVSATIAAQGFVVVTFSPQRGTDLEADMDDVLKLISHVHAKQLSAKGGTGRLGLLGGSLTSLHVWRVAQLTRDVQAVAVLGGVSDVFLIRRRFESNELLLEPPFDVPLSYALIGLGRPNLEPQVYLRYSPVYHLDALPRVPLALIHGGRDKTVPYEQTPHFSSRLTARGVQHEVYLYPDQEHYLQLSPPTATELDMLEKVVGFLRGALK